MKRKRTRRVYPDAKVCILCGRIFSGRSRKFCGPECRAEHIKEYHRNYHRKKRGDPYIKKTMVPTNYKCEFCNGIIYQILDNDGLIKFNRRFYCHKESCQQAYRDRGRSVEDHAELHLEKEH